MNLPHVHLLRSLKIFSRTVLTSLMIFGAWVGSGNADDRSADNTVNIYTYRQPSLILPVLERFTKDTGIKVKTLFASKGLIERVKSEASLSPADVIIAMDISILESAKALGITQPLELDNETLSSVPKAYHDPDNQWVALTLRSRVIYASKERTQVSHIDYEDLADPVWKGRICTRSGKHPYNNTLIASMIATHGVDKTRDWLVGLRDNLARPPAGNDRAQVKAIYAGLCDISLGNTYYMAAMMNNEKKSEEKLWASNVRILFPNADNRGSHVNITGAAIAAHAPHPDLARKLVTWMLSESAQELYAAKNYEYPVRQDASIDPLVKSWGKLKADKTSLGNIATYRRQASQLADEVQFDAGAQ